MAIPLPVSAGTNIKVLEALACAKAIVSTGVGCAGLGLRDGRELAIRNDTESFVEAVCGYLADPASRIGTGQQARRTAESRFGWNTIAARAYESYEVVAGIKAMRGAPAAIV